MPACVLSLQVTCDFDSRTRTEETQAGNTHNDEMCNMYMMVYARHPVISMCNTGEFGHSDTSPGGMPKQSIWVPDPCPFWQPPVPKGASGANLGDATGVAVGGDGSLWALYR